MPGDYQVGVYYFGNYHVDPRNEAVHGPGWTEWELVKRGEPRFPGHQQPKVPAWGYEDESDPAVFARKIDAAADHGIDYFIFDWYWYDDGPFLDRALDKGYLGAANNSRLKFCLMWANHNWVDIHPQKAHAPSNLLYPGQVTPETWETITDVVVERYFKHPSHWLIDGCPYFSIYDLYRFMENFGGVRETRAAIDRFRAKTKAAGFPDLHLNIVMWMQPIVPGETVPRDPDQLVGELGFDSVTSYVWVHHAGMPNFPQTEYTHLRDRYLEYWDRAEATYHVPYYPNVSMGWDSSPRTVQSDVFENIGYPFTPTLANNTPAAFREALAITKARLDRRSGPKIMNMNAWNEWTEGSYLEPDTINGMGYLEAVRDVFGA